MNWRQIEHNGKMYKWSVGSGGHCVIRDSETNEKIGAPNFPEITGGNWDSWLRGKRKGTSEGNISPGHVRMWLRRNIK